MPELRNGKPRFWVSWVADLLGGDDQCKWKVWFKARYRYDKLEDEEDSSLQRWRRNHDELVQRRAQHLPDEWKVWRENETEFVLEGNGADVAGKCDFVAQSPSGDTLVADGKTGRPSAKHWWQVLLYMYCLPRSRKDFNISPEKFSGEVTYASAPAVYVSPGELTDERRARMFALIRELSDSQPPPHTPSYNECRRCNIGPSDCSKRMSAPIVGKTEDF